MRRLMTLRRRNLIVASLSIIFVAGPWTLPCLITVKPPTDKNSSCLVIRSGQDTILLFFVFNHTLGSSVLGVIS